MALEIFGKPKRDEKRDAPGGDAAPTKKSKVKPLTAAYVRDQYKKGTDALRREQWNYVLNKLVVGGEQWVRYDENRNTIRPYPREASRVQATVNRLWPASRHLMAKLLSRELVFEVPAAETDDASIKGARTAEAVLADLKREHNWEHVREQLAWDAWLGGTSILSVEWDASKGPTIGHTEFGTPYGTGEINEEPLSILEVAWEPGSRDAERGYWWIRAQALPPCEVATMYDLDEEPAADASAAQGYMGRGLGTTQTREANLMMSLVLTYYERPNPKRPEGAVCTVVGDKIVDGPHPWPFPWEDHLNLVVFRETKQTGKAQGDTVLSAAVPVQVAYNAACSCLLEHLKLSGNTRLWVPDGSLDEIDELTDLPAEIVNYIAAAGKPTWESPPSLPSWIMDQPRMLAQQIDDILGLHEISRGVAPEGIESGVGLSVLIEQDTTPLGALTRELAFGFERFATMCLELYAANVKETRKARVKSPHSTPEVLDWTGKSLAGQTIAVVPMDAVMPRSRTALMAFAKEMWDRKIINDPQVFARVADVPSQEYLIEALNEDIAKAERENRAMATGRPVVPEDFDDHAVHIKCHNKFRKSLRYETMTEEEKQLCDQHIQAHATMAGEEMGTQTNKEMQFPGLSTLPTPQGSPPGLGLPPEMAAAGAPGLPPMGPPAQPEPDANLQDPMGQLVPQGDQPS